MLAVLLGAALTALLVDRVLLGSAPAAADGAATAATPPAQAGAAGHTTVATAPAQPPPATPEVTLAQRLSGLAETSRLDAMAVRDAFRPPQSWQGETPRSAADPNADELRARKFAERHRLRATAVTADGRMALIDDQCLAVGQSLDGFELVSVGSDWAELACGNLRVALRLDKTAHPGK